MKLIEKIGFIFGFLYVVFGIPIFCFKLYNKPYMTTGLDAKPQKISICKQNPASIMPLSAIEAGILHTCLEKVPQVSINECKNLIINLRKGGNE